MSGSIFGIATSGLNAAQAGLLTTSHNIANVNTPGFSRQQVVQENAQPNFTGAGFLGSGVAVATVRRAYSEFLALQARDSQARAAAAGERSTQLSAIDNLLADPAAGLAPALNDFFQGLQDLAAHPADSAARQAFLSRAEALSARMRDLDSQLGEMRHGTNLQVASSVNSINAYGARIADLNQRILEAGGQSGSGQMPNDLMDQRDALLSDLNAEVGAAAVVQSDGTVNVFLSSGQALVVGTNAYALAVAADPESPQDAIVTLRSGATQMQLRPGDISGGRLGGLLEYRETDLTAARNALGRIAIGLGEDFNRQHRLGQDRDGAPGAAFFATGAASAAARSTNSGTAQLAVAVVDAGALTTSGYRAAWDGASWQLTRLEDGVSQSFATLPQTLDGFTISLASGAAAVGDSFRIEPTAAGAAGFSVLVRNPNAIAVAAPIRTGAASTNTGSGRISAGSVDAPPPVNANLQQPVTLTFTSAGTFDVSGTGTGNPAGVALVAGATISYNGWSVTLDGTPAAGDTFTISANAGGVSDNRNALLLGALQTRRGLENGAASYADAYGQLVGTIGNRAREAQISSAAQAALAVQAESSLQSLSGVNLDEEAANLLRYQQAYQAAGRALAIADTLFDTLLNIGR